jgi:hypothetical protein
VIGNDALNSGFGRVPTVSTRELGKLGALVCGLGAGL